MNTTFLFEEKFEEAVEKQLQDIGYRTARSLYISTKDVTSQIDILACGFGNLLCVECKSMILTKLRFSRYGKDWFYLDDDDRYYTMHSPYLQNYNHIKTIKAYVSDSGYNSILLEKFGIPLPIILNINIFKNTLDLSGLSQNSKTSVGIYRIDELGLLKDLYQGNIKDQSLREEVCDFIFDKLKVFSDTSYLRKLSHSNYIARCKEKGMGYFSSRRA